MKYTVRGYDQFGNTVVETIDVPKKTWVESARLFLVRILGLRLPSRLGLTKSRRISKIVIHE